MKYPCEMIEDLLPLYNDDVCSSKSQKIIKEHLAECDSCNTLFDKLKNNVYDNTLQKERDEIMKHRAQKTRKVGLIVTLSLLAIPILTCFIINLATMGRLDWFFIVVASLFVFSSLTVVPIFVREKKFLWSISSFTASLLLLLMVCAIYSGGTWFFSASLGVLLGLAIVFLPIVLYQLQLDGFIGRHKGLVAMSANTILLGLLIIFSANPGTSSSYWLTAFSTSAFSLLLPWGLFVVIRYFKCNGFIKTGICCILGTLFPAISNDVIAWLLGGTFSLSMANVNLNDWTTSGLTNANINFLMLSCGIVVGIIFFIIGGIRRKR